MKKKCSTCQIILDLTHFHANKRSKDGLCNRCKTCGKEYQRSAETKERRRKRDSKNRPKINKFHREYAKQNREQFNEYQRNYYYAHYEHNRKRINAYCAREDRKYANNAKAAKRRAKLAFAAFKEFKDQVDEIYRKCPAGFHVDHIVPLNGVNVSGLHVPWNLQYLPSVDNLKKGNKFEG